MHRNGGRLVVEGGGLDRNAWKVGALHAQQDLPGFNVHHLVLVKTAAPAASTSSIT